jgi:predicted nucleic acid-binding Zn ribbon protein
MITIAGGELLSHRGTTVTYKLRCDNCGNIDETESSITVMKGVTEVTTKKCPKCGANQIVKMKFDLN